MRSSSLGSQKSPIINQGPWFCGDNTGVYNGKLLQKLTLFKHFFNLCMVDGYANCGI